MILGRHNLNIRQTSISMHWLSPPWWWYVERGRGGKGRGRRGGIGKGEGREEGRGWGRDKCH